jgi:hypothetical protein
MKDPEISPHSYCQAHFQQKHVGEKTPSQQIVLEKLDIHM